MKLLKMIRYIGKNISEISPRACNLRVVGCEEPVKQQADTSADIYLLIGWQPLVQVVVNTRQNRLQARHVDFQLLLYTVQTVLPESLNHIPNVN